MAKAKNRPKKLSQLLPESHDAYGYIALGIILVVLYVLVTGVNVV